jgi:hypothetical protein
MSDNESAPLQPATRALRRRSAKDNFVEALALLSRVAEPKLDLAQLRQLMDLGDEEWKAPTSRIMEAIAVALGGAAAAPFAQCPHCDGTLEVPAPEVQVGNVETFQKSNPVYFQWSPYEMRKLLEHLHQHPGHVLITNLAQSVDIREPSGRVYTFRRDGKVT